MLHGDVDLVSHASADRFAEVPKLVAFRKQRKSGVDAELSVFGNVVIEELREIDVRRNGDEPKFLNHVFAVEVILDFDTTCVEVGFLTSAQVGQKLDFGLPTNLVGGWVFIPDKLSGS